ncbi:uncharacterized protein LOC111345771 [Stylophora pistillata]|uniref:uncharacterized protein LOC111345771 n=1 Tax=Stylophora pistillata TaxID=50429 RepID=UPI000C0425AD|nr:uncharacterized protein LOC111345771 [Stylophora pistillata]
MEKLALSPPADPNSAYCKDVSFNEKYNSTPNVFVSANHSTSGGNLQPMHNGITAWVEFINETGLRVCLKEFYEIKYDPLSVSYTVFSDENIVGLIYANQGGVISTAAGILQTRV